MVHKVKKRLKAVWNTFPALDDNSLSQARDDHQPLTFGSRWQRSQCSRGHEHVQVRPPFLYFCNFVHTYIHTYVFMCVHVLYIFDWGQVQVRRPSHKSLKKQILYLVPFQPARPQCVPNNHQRANFREEEVQRVQEEILLRHAGRTRLSSSKKYFSNQMLSSAEHGGWTDQIPRGGDPWRPVPRSLHAANAVGCCALKMWIIRSTFFKAIFVFQKTPWNILLPVSSCLICFCEQYPMYSH